MQIMHVYKTQKPNSIKKISNFTIIRRKVKISHFSKEFLGRTKCMFHETLRRLPKMME